VDAIVAGGGGGGGTGNNALRNYNNQYWNPATTGPLGE